MGEDDLVRNLTEWCPSDGHDAWPIMRQAAVEIRSLRAQVERLFNDGIHTCHDQCPRFGCVQRREIESLRAQVAQWAECALYDATMEGPVFKGWNRSALERCRLAAIEAQQDKEITDD